MHERHNKCRTSVLTLNGIATISFGGQVLAVIDAKRVKKTKLPKKRLLKKSVKRKGAR
jgi:hypothetical protein